MAKVNRDTLPIQDSRFLCPHWSVFGNPPHDRRCGPKVGRIDQFVTGKKVATMAGFKSIVLCTVLSALCLSLQSGCSSQLAASQQGQQLADAKEKIGRLETVISRLEDKGKKSQVEHLKKQNQHEKENGQNRLQLGLLQQENDQLKRQTDDLKNRLDMAERKLVEAKPTEFVPQRPRGGNPDTGLGDTEIRIAAGPGDAGQQRPRKNGKDDAECKDCAKPFVGRLTKCIDGNCVLGFVSHRVFSHKLRTKVSVKFPCPSCMGLGRMPCLTCRDKDHGFVLSQVHRVSAMIKKDKTEWIRVVGLYRQLHVARSGLARSKKAGERSLYLGQISGIEAQVTKINEKRLEIAYAIGDLYREAFEASLKNIPASEHAALRRKGAKAIDRFNELFIRGFYH